MIYNSKNIFETKVNDCSDHVAINLININKEGESIRLNFFPSK